MEQKLEAHGFPKDDNQGGEGRPAERGGQGLNDEKFHEVAMGLTPEKENDQLETLESVLPDLEEALAREIATRNPAIGAKAYGELLTKHPDDAKSAEWRKAKDSLENGK